jgi:hypothetical protein
MELWGEYFVYNGNRGNMGVLPAMLENRTSVIEDYTKMETFTCTPYILALLLVLLETFRSVYEDPLVKSLQSITVPDWVHNLVPFTLSTIIIALIVVLFDRQNEVIMEEEYIQVGNSPFHFFRADEIEEIKFKGGFLVIRTRYFWRTGRYHVKKKQRDIAHQMLSEWSYQHDLTYIRIF